MIWQKIKNAWRSRTVWYGLFVSIGGYLQAEKAQLDPLLPEDMRPYIWPAVGLGIIILRFATTQAVDQKGKQ